MSQFQRWVHAAVIVGTAVLCGWIVAYGITCGAIHYQWSQGTLLATAYAAWGVIGVAAIFAVWANLRYRWLAPAALVSGIAVLALAWDGAEKPSFDVGPMVARDAASFLAYQTLLKSGAGSRVAERPPEVINLPHPPADVADWPNFYRDNRAVYEAAWQKDTLGREWVAGMAANSPSGLFPLVNYEGPLLDFRAVRSTAWLQWGHAYLLASDGQPDAAAKALTTFLLAHYNLQRGGSTLITQMIAMVCVRGTYQRLDQLVAAGKLSSGVRREIAAVLARAPDPGVVFKNACIGEKQFGRSWLEDATRSSQTAAKALAETEGTALFTMPGLHRLLVNPNRDEQLTFARMDEIQGWVEQRQIDRLKEAAAKIDERRWHWKNPLGELFNDRGRVSMSKAALSALETEDRRQTLLRAVDQGVAAVP
jgi:hypothetical protein